ncbi:MAG: Tad domain-containing protein [Planctomycetota bacterium]|nr:Tad domain-containing protein [Planctomycetota bacterium]
MSNSSNPKPMSAADRLQSWWQVVSDRIGSVRRLHHDQRGTISILTVFSLLMFTMLLVMITNVGRHLDDKVRMQNAADASAYSGGVVVSRGMNAIAFTNHLLTDVFAMTAYLREGAQRNAESLTPEIIAEWERAGQTFQMAETTNFRQMGTALERRAKMEKDLIKAYGEMSAAASELALPVFEHILAGEESQASANDPGTQEEAQIAGQFGLIPQFQRTVLETIPTLAQGIVDEIAFRHGLTNQELEDPQAARGTSIDPRGPQVGVMWRMSIEPVAMSNEANPMTRTLPVIDVNLGGDTMVSNIVEYRDQAIEQRKELAKHYLEEWNQDKLRFFDREARLSQFSNLWRVFTCAHLDDLLIFEYPLTNLPMVIRQTEFGVPLDQLADDQSRNEHVERSFNFVVTVHRKHMRESGPGLFQNPLKAESDAVAFSQVTLFVPRGRRYLTYAGGGGGGGGGGQIGLGGTFGFDSSIQLPPRPATPSANADPRAERWPRENWPSHWDLLNQNWTTKLVPATGESIAQILQTNSGADFRPLNLNGMTQPEINQINTH